MERFEGRDSNAKQHNASHFLALVPTLPTALPAVVLVLASSRVPVPSRLAWSRLAHICLSDVSVLRRRLLDVIRNVGDTRDVDVKRVVGVAAPPTAGTI